MVGTFQVQLLLLVRLLPFLLVMKGRKQEQMAVMVLVRQETEGLVEAVRVMTDREKGPGYH